MKKKLVTTMLVLSLGAMTLTGCTKKETELIPNNNPIETIDKTDETNNTQKEDVKNEIILEDDEATILLKDNMITITSTDPYCFLPEEYDTSIISVTGNDDMTQYTVSAVSDGTIQLIMSGFGGPLGLTYAIDITIKDNNMSAVISDVIKLEYEDPFAEAENEVEADLSAIMDSIYSEISEEYYPGSVFTMPIANEEDMKYNLGTSNLPGYEAGAVSNPMISSIAHSLCVLRFDTNENAQLAANKLLENPPIAKWICVSAERAATKIIDGRYVIFAMSTEDFISALNASNIGNTTVDSCCEGEDLPVNSGTFVIPVPIETDSCCD